VFLAQFDKTSDTLSLGDIHQDHLLRDISELTRFAPAVRAVYVLLSQSSPTPEDRAALVQCLYHICQEIPQHFVDPTRILDNSQSLFGWLYQRASLRTDGSKSPVLGYLHSFKTKDLVCRITNEPVIDAVMTTDDGIVERCVAEEYQSLALRRTRTFNFGATQIGTASQDRLSSFSGGRFRKVVWFNHAFHHVISTLPPSPHVLAPIDLNGFLNSLNSSPLAIIAPKDLKSVTAPALTRDSQGAVCVYTGRAACAVAPVEYFPH
jgi:hypothetical protein